MSYALMQPYFFPYGGYYQLVERVDYFIIFDNAQFPRRGRVHRCSALNWHGNTSWITLPTVKAPQKSPIDDIHLDTATWSQFTNGLRRFPAVLNNLARFPEIERALKSPTSRLVEFLIGLLEQVSTLAGLEHHFIRASDVLPRKSFSYQEYACALGHELSEREYVNASGGRDLYDSKYFSDRGLSLTFMPPYQGPSTSILDQEEPFAW